MKNIFGSLVVVILMVGTAIVGGLTSEESQGISWAYLIMGLFGGPAFYLLDTLFCESDYPDISIFRIYGYGSANCQCTHDI